MLCDERWDASSASSAGTIENRCVEDGE